MYVDSSSAILFSSGAIAEQVDQGKWAEKSDPVAQKLIEQEKEWATLPCTQNNVITDFIADDFVGTHPKGSLYNKSGLISRHAPSPAAEWERDCKLLSAKVRFYGPDIAVIYGSESAVVKAADGMESTRALIWIDTVLRRGERWQVVAVQDMVAPSK